MLSQVENLARNEFRDSWHSLQLLKEDKMVEKLASLSRDIRRITSSKPTK